MAAVAATSSYGQGSTFFSSYTANQGVGATTSIFGGGGLVGIPWTAQLYYSLGTVSDPVNESDPTSITSPITGLTPLAGALAAYDNSGAATGAPGMGFFDGGVVLIPGYTSGPVTFEIWASGGATGSGRSGSWTESAISGPGLPAGNFGDNGTMPNFVVVVPEPTTLALAGLGALASFVAKGRKRRTQAKRGKKQGK